MQCGERRSDNKTNNKHKLVSLRTSECINRVEEMCSISIEIEQEKMKKGK